MEYHGKPTRKRKNQLINARLAHRIKQEEARRDNEPVEEETEKVESERIDPLFFCYI